MADGQSTPESHAHDREENGTKRRQDSQTSQPRAKRNRYISIACNECKRRKIKCNGETPCQRCGNLNLACIYAPNCCSSNFKDTDEFKQMTAQIASLQDQVDSLYQNLAALRRSLGQEDYSPDGYHYNAGQPGSMQAPQASMSPNSIRRSRVIPKQPRFQGPTSSAYGFDVARSSLQNMGITGPDDPMMEENAITRENLRLDSSQTQESMVSSEKDPIWHITKDEALRLCRVYEEEMGLMYPVLDIERVMQHAKMLFTFMDAASRTMFVKYMPGADAMVDPDTDIVKLIIAIAMVTEGTGQSELGKKLFESVSGSAESRLLGNVDLKCIQILVLIAMYHFHTDDEGLSWRVIGLTARLCIELGLHRAETYPKMFPDETELAAAVRVFWSIYVLDRRWSLGTGMSFALQDSDIDPALPKPGDSSPYLSAMITYSHIGSKVWKTTTSSDAAGLNNVFSKDEISYLDYQVIQWQRTIPDSLRYIHPNSSEFQKYHQLHGVDPNATDSRALYRLRIILHLRGNQMRILIHRPVLHSATSILSTSNGQFAHTVVDVAKDTIHVLTHINQTSDIYRTQQMCFNYFLTSALAVLFLAVSHAPAQFSEICRDEFYMALDLVRALSGNSHVSKRLWRTIRGLKEIGPRLGLYARNGEGEASSRSSTSNAGAQEPTATQQQQQQQGTKASGPRHHSTGSNPQSQLQYDAHSSAAMAMAGLAGHRVDESTFFANLGGGAGGGAGMQQANGANGAAGNDAASFGGSTPSGTSPNGMANELTSLFEAAGAYAAQHDTAGITDASPTPASANVFATAGPDALGAAVAPAHAHASATGWGNEDEISRIMMDLF